MSEMISKSDVNKGIDIIVSTLSMTGILLVLADEKIAADTTMDFLKLMEAFKEGINAL